MEIRTSIGEIKLITRNKGKEKIISGYAVKWDKWSKKIREGGKSFYERVKKNAFLESLKEKDQFALFLHNKDEFLGSMKDGTLFLEEDEIGLSFKLILPDNKLGDRVFKEVQKGKLSHVSFSFNNPEVKWETKDNEKYRTLLKARLFEISPVYNPAYLDSVVVEGDKRVNLQLLSKIDRLSLEMKKQEILNQINKILR